MERHLPASEALFDEAADQISGQNLPVFKKITKKHIELRCTLKKLFDTYWAIINCLRTYLYYWPEYRTKEHCEIRKRLCLAPPVKLPDGVKQRQQKS